MQSANEYDAEHIILNVVLTLIYKLISGEKMPFYAVAKYK